MHIKLLQSRKFISIFLSVSIGKIYTNLAKLDFAINSVGKETNCILSVSKKRLQEEDAIIAKCFKPKDKVFWDVEVSKLDIELIKLYIELIKLDVELIKLDIKLIS